MIVCIGVCLFVCMFSVGPYAWMIIYVFVCLCMICMLVSVYVCLSVWYYYVTCVGMCAYRFVCLYVLIRCVYARMTV